MIVPFMKIKKNGLLKNMSGKSSKDKMNRLEPVNNDLFFQEFKIKSSTKLITKTIQNFEQLLDQVDYCSSRNKNEVTTAFSEAIANAIIHGNKNQSNKFVYIKINITKKNIILHIQDEGTGFNHKTLPNPLDKHNLTKPNGRGVYLMTVLMDKVQFRRHKIGMEVILTKKC